MHNSDKPILPYKVNIVGYAFVDTVGRSGAGTLKERTEDPNRPYYVRHSCEYYKILPPTLVDKILCFS